MGMERTKRHTKNSSKGTPPIRWMWRRLQRWKHPRSWSWRWWFLWEEMGGCFWVSCCWRCSDSSWWCWFRMFEVGFGYVDCSCACLFVCFLRVFFSVLFCAVCWFDSAWWNLCFVFLVWANWILLECWRCLVDLLMGSVAQSHLRESRKKQLVRSCTQMSIKDGWNTSNMVPILKTG